MLTDEVLIIVGTVTLLQLCIMCISLTHDITPVLWAYGVMGQLGRVQLPVNRAGIVVVGKLLC